MTISNIKQNKVSGGWNEKNKEFSDCHSCPWHGKNEDGKEYQGVGGHVKNFLPFLEGRRPIAFDQPQKRTYTRRTVKRGLL